MSRSSKDDGTSRGEGSPGAEREVSFAAPFGAMDRETRDLFARYCEVEMAKIRLQQQQLDNEALDRSRLDRESEPRLLVDNARAQAEAQKIADAAALDRAKAELEIRKLRIEGQKLEGEAMVAVAARAAEVFWPRIEQFGAGIMRLNLEQFSLIREEMRLLAGRDPGSGSKS